MPSTFEFCIPTRATKVPFGPEWLHEIKYDGYRLRLERDGDRVLQPFGARTPIGRVVTYRLKTATTKTAIKTTTPAAMIASSTFGIFNASFSMRRSI
jgi:ATP-dependent DNA ligase